MSSSPPPPLKPLPMKDRILTASRNQLIRGNGEYLKQQQLFGLAFRMNKTKRFLSILLQGPNIKLNVLMF